jgi:outer membrane lipoprotein-sorting protein
MSKQKILFFSALFCLLLAGKGEAFVPQPPHLLHLMIQKIKQPAGMVVHQTRNVMVSGRETGPEAGTGMESETKTEIKTVEVDEKIVYDSSGKFRSDIVSGMVSRFYVESDSQFIKVADGRIVSLKKSPVDFYTDPLLYRDHESLLNQLVLAGVDTQQVTFKRLDNKICYFIGLSLNQGESSGLWIEKKSLFPIRYVIEQNGWRVSFHYEAWQRVSKTWYPMRITIVVDDQVFTKIEVKRFELESGFPESLFDVNQIQGQYPAATSAQEKGQDVPGRFDELDKQMENFKKLYE